MQTKQTNNILNRLTRQSLYNQIVEDQFIFDMLTSQRDECDRCQSNKVLCILQPKCGPNREFLNILIGISHQDIPSFCYKQRLRELNRFLDLRKEIPNGMKVNLDDYLSQKGVKASGSISFELLKTLECYKAGVDLHPLWLVAINDDYVMIDVELSVVTFNPWNFQISGKDFEPILIFFLQCHNFIEPYHFVEETTDHWIIKISIKCNSVNFKALDNQISQSKLNITYYNDTTESIHLIAEIPATQHFILFRTLNKIVRKLATLRILLQTDYHGL